MRTPIRCNPHLHHPAISLRLKMSRPHDTSIVVMMGLCSRPTAKRTNPPRPSAGPLVCHSQRKSAVALCHCCGLLVCHSRRGSAVAVAVALAGRRPKASALGLSGRSSRSGFSPWGVRRPVRASTLRVPHLRQSHRLRWGRTVSAPIHRSPIAMSGPPKPVKPPKRLFTLQLAHSK